MVIRGVRTFRRSTASVNAYSCREEKENFGLLVSLTNLLKKPYSIKALPRERDRGSVGFARGSRIGGSKCSMKPLISEEYDVL